MIVVTGANGQIGRAITEKLLELVPAGQIGVSVREPEKARDLEERGVRVRQGDFDDAASLDRAFEGASQVLIVSSNSRSDSAVSQHPAAIDAAKRAGAERILYTSHMGSDPSSPFPPMRNHAGTEEALRESGVSFTSLRNGFYASPTPMMMLGNALETGELVAPEDGPVAWTTRADLAEAAAIILTGEGIDGPTPALTASETVDAAGIAAIASEITGRRIRRVVVSDDEYRNGLLDNGTPEPGADMLLGLFAASRQGDFSPADPTLARLIGREPTPLRDVLEASIYQEG